MRELRTRRAGATSLREPPTRRLSAGPRRNRTSNRIGALVPMVLVICVAACTSMDDTVVPQKPDHQNLKNPAEDGERVLDSLSEVNPPVGASEPRMVGSHDMTTGQFVQSVTRDLNAKWRAKFEDSRYAYSETHVVLYSEPIPIDGCTGVASPESGPFYCGKTRTVYYPLNWVAPRGDKTPVEIGDFAVAVILGHEVGHHVQYLLGILGDPGLYTIQRELQADCLAGVWVRSVYEQGSLERGDVEEALEILEDMADLRGTPSTDPTAHGDERQRVDAFMTGFETGYASECKL